MVVRIPHDYTNHKERVFRPRHIHDSSPRLLRRSLGFRTGLGQLFQHLPTFALATGAQILSTRVNIPAWGQIFAGCCVGETFSM